MSNENNRLIVKSNKLIEASYRLTLNEQRVLLAGISQIDSRNSLEENMTFEVHAQDIQDLVGLEDNKNIYRALKAASEKLYERTVVIDDPDPSNPAITKRKTRWISSIDYIPGEGRLVMIFSAGIIPYLSSLTSSFTKYKLTHIARFESVYSIRMYEMFSQWSGVGRFEITLDEFRERLQVQNLYKRVTDLKKRVIDPGVKEINLHSNLDAKYGLRKTGKVITHIQFEFKAKPGAITDKMIRDAARPGESSEQVAARLKMEQKSAIEKQSLHQPQEREASSSPVSVDEYRKQALAITGNKRKIQTSQ
ncbi:MAG: RepB family plasmid replication initiator protein [Methylophaga sp.]|uniref:RepB family plasmid replication initiator protein n=1 Tax=Methylophaga sp. TaxID=2024840 RepID=UPI00271CC155|nr:RepB family plasmid replication initiator protein [Methylophaga sp.]MDO8827766.1 RepB family plasmid replication initiator protein [Methylophaga sp.]MDX1750691.1 RepB family plasmid replication initiator protein [Methylophaga sp.]